jgi:hypothetical protein
MVDVGTVVVRGALDGSRHQCLVVAAVIWCRGWRSVGHLPRPVNEPSRAELWQTRLGSFKKKNNRAELGTPGSSSAQ